MDKKIIGKSRFFSVVMHLAVVLLCGNTRFLNADWEAQKNELIEATKKEFKDAPRGGFQCFINLLPYPIEMRLYYYPPVSICGYYDKLYFAPLQSGSKRNGTCRVKEIQIRRDGEDFYVAQSFSQGAPGSIRGLWLVDVGADGKYVVKLLNP